jgi:hypothetical protein
MEEEKDNIVYLILLDYLTGEVDTFDLQVPIKFFQKHLYLKHQYYP